MTENAMLNFMEKEMKLGLFLYRKFMWNIATHLFNNVYLKPYYNFYKTRQSDPFPDAPFIVVCNHGTFFDPWIIGTYSKTPFAYMTNDDGFRGKGITPWYLKSIGAFPKKKGASDFKAMKTTMELLRDNYPVCIFPEGQTTWDGETQLIYRGIEKIIKKLEVSVVTIHLQGNFLVKPWWAATKRKGSISVNIKVIDKETVKTMTTDQIFDIIKTSIYQNDIKDPRNSTIPFRGTMLAEGLERLVWICMDCGCEDSLVTEGDTITCTSCGKKWSIDAHCKLKSLTPSTASLDDLKDWSEMHKEKVRSRVLSGASFTTETPAAGLYCENDKKEFDLICGPGSLSLSDSELRYCSGGDTKAWPVAVIEDYVVQKKDIFEFRLVDKTWRVVFSARSPMKWVYYIRYMKNFTTCEAQGHL